MATVLPKAGGVSWTSRLFSPKNLIVISEKCSRRDQLSSPAAQFWPNAQ